MGKRRSEERKDPTNVAIGVIGLVAAAGLQRKRHMLEA